MSTGYEFWTPEAQRNPYPIYRKIREEIPVIKNGNNWMLSRHKDVSTLLPDRRMSAIRGHLGYLDEEERAKNQALIEANKYMILFLDPTDHTRLRSLVAQAFSARRIQDLRTRVGELVDELLAGVEPGQPWDLIDTLANPLARPGHRRIDRRPDFGSGQLHPLGQ